MSKWEFFLDLGPILFFGLHLIDPRSSLITKLLSLNLQLYASNSSSRNIRVCNVCIEAVWCLDGIDGMIVGFWAHVEPNCQARGQVPNPLSQQAPNPDSKVRPSIKNPKTQFYGLGCHNNCIGPTPPHHPPLTFRACSHMTPLAWAHTWTW